MILAEADRRQPPLRRRHGARPRVAAGRKPASWSACSAPTAPARPRSQPAHRGTAARLGAGPLCGGDPRDPASRRRARRDAAGDRAAADAAGRRGRRLRRRRTTPTRCRRPNCSTGSGWPTWSGGRPAACPAARSGGWRSRWRSSAGPGSWSSTSRPPASTCRPGASLWDAIRAFHDEGGTVLLTSHYLEEIEALAEAGRGARRRPGAGRRHGRARCAAWSACAGSACRTRRAARAARRGRGRARGRPHPRADHRRRRPRPRAGRISVSTVPRPGGAPDLARGGLPRDHRRRSRSRCRSPRPSEGDSHDPHPGARPVPAHRDHPDPDRRDRHRVLPGRVDAVLRRAVRRRRPGRGHVRDRVDGDVRGAWPATCSTTASGSPRTAPSPGTRTPGPCRSGPAPGSPAGSSRASR